MKKSVLYLTVAFYLLVAFPALVPVSAKETWTSVQSKNFLLVGNASEKEIRQVAARLEQFREVFSRLFTKINFRSPVPTTVIVFKSHNSYKPFKPIPNIAGYFQPGRDVNYITLTTDVEGEQDSFSIIFHEYTHLMLNNTSGNVPTWFNEGLAEYYSTFSVRNDQTIELGRPIASHVHLLRQNKMLPLRTLFQVDHQSPYYNERDKQSIFYAESWALMHYLILGNDGKRLPQMRKFMELVSANIPMEQAFQQAFATTFESMENELRQYIGGGRYVMVSSHFENKLGFDKAMQSAPVNEAEAQAYLGDLLFHSDRADAESYLKKALALDPNLAMAHGSMGLLRAREGKSEEARQSLERAVAANSQNYFIHYYYAVALSREGEKTAESVREFAPERVNKIREELKKAIDLRPDFLESYSLLVFINLVTGSQLDESVAMLKSALVTYPDRNDLVFLLAQVYMRKEDLKTARQLLEKLDSSNDEGVRQRARRLLVQLDSMSELIKRTGTLNDVRASQPSPTPADSVSSGEEPPVVKIDPAFYQREALRKPAPGETQTQGTLVRVECDAKGITFVVKIGERLLKLRTDSFDNVDITSFSRDAGNEIRCGARKPKNNVIVNYISANDAGAKFDGVAKSIEFVPQDFKLKP